MADTKEVKHLVDIDAYRHAEDECNSLIKKGDGSLVYTELGGDCNVWDKDGDNKELKQADDTVVEDNSVCKKKTVLTKFKAGFDDSSEAWPLGLKRAETGVQYKLKPVSLVVSEDLSSWVEVTNAAGVSLTDDLELSSIFGDYADLKFVPCFSGVQVEHLIKKKLYDEFGATYTYGAVKWETDGNNDIMDELVGDNSGMHGTHIIQDKPNNAFYEYFWLDEMEEGDFRHYYTTLTGVLSSNQTLNGGSTYYLSGVVHMGGYDVDTSGSGNVVIKHNTGDAAAYWNWNADGSSWTHSGSSSFKVIMTSKNDDSVGETISGSSGSPSFNDVREMMYCYTTSAWNGEIDIDWFEVHYAGSDTGGRPIIAVGVNAVDAAKHFPLTLKHGIIRNCKKSLSQARVGMFGSAVIHKLVDDFTFENIDIDSTVEVYGAGAVNGIFDYENTQAGAKKMVVNNCTITPTKNGTGDPDLICPLDFCSFEMKNTYIKCADADNYVHYTSVSSVGSDTFDFVMKNNVIEGATGTDHLIYCLHSGGTVNMTVENNIFRDQPTAARYAFYHNGAGGWTGTLDYNIFWNNPTNYDYFSPDVSAGPNNYGDQMAGAFEITEDPQGNIPAGATRVTTEIAHPDGLAVTLSKVIEQGSESFDTAGIDESKYSMTGYEYAGTDNVTAGIYYEFSAFAPTPSGGVNKPLLGSMF